jgi:hypothetical protein
VLNSTDGTRKLLPTPVKLILADAQPLRNIGSRIPLLDDPHHEIPFEIVFEM